MLKWKFMYTVNGLCILTTPCVYWFYKVSELHKTQIESAHIKSSTSKSLFPVHSLQQYSLAYIAHFS